MKGKIKPAIDAKWMEIKITEKSKRHAANSATKGQVCTKCYQMKLH